MAGAVFVLAQSAAIVLLLFQRARRKRAELALEASGQHLRGVLNALFAFVGVMTTDGILVESNSAPLEAAGIDAAEVLGKPFWQCYWWSHSPHEQERLRAAILKAREGESSRYDVEIRVKNGVMPVDFMLTPMRQRQDRVSYLIASAVPIAERKRAEETLRKSEEQFRTLAETLPGILFITDRAGHNVYVNRYYRQYTGLGDDDLVGDRGLRLVHPEDVARTLAACERCVRDGRFYEIEHRIRHYDFSWRWHLTRGIPLRSEDGSIERWLGISTDIHAQKQAETVLRRANDDLRQLIWAASHDLQEPARMVLTFTQLLAERCPNLDGQASRFLNHATEGARRLCEHLSALRAYWEVSDETAVSPLERVDMNAVLSEVLQSLQAEIDAAEAVVSCTEMPALRVDRTAAVQVLYHLIRNCTQYRDPDRPLQIHVTAGRQESDWTFRVDDNGVGIAPEHQRHIFDLFKRLHSHRDVAGSGMGLALCRRIIERAGGQIGVDSELGRGSCFWFTLPQTVVEEKIAVAGHANSAD
jgi:PAS domain S-box-containing protein